MITTAKDRFLLRKTSRRAPVIQSFSFYSCQYLEILAVRTREADTEGREHGFLYKVMGEVQRKRMNLVHVHTFCYVEKGTRDITHDDPYPEYTKEELVN